MKVFLTGISDHEWRHDIVDFLTRQQIDFFDPTAYPTEFSSIFEQLKILESCDLLIAYLIGMPARHLMPFLEMSYALKLAKEVMIVDDTPRTKNWFQASSFSTSVPDLNAVKDRLTRMLISQCYSPQPRLLG